LSSQPIKPTSSRIFIYRFRHASLPDCTARSH
jgi:hypothetical protein